MVITPATQQALQVLFFEFQDRFWQNYSAAMQWSPRIATTIPTGTQQVLFPWIGMLDKYRLWNGSRVVHQPAPQTYLVTTQPFELTEAIDQFKVEDDITGVYMPTVTFMGIQAKKWMDYQIRDLLKNQGAWTGSAQTGPDGISFWSTAHPVDFYDSTKGTYANDFTGGGFTVNGILTGGALNVNPFATLWQEFASRKSESGEPLGLIPDLTGVAPQLNITAMTILNAQFFAPSVIGNIGTGTANVGATENMLKGSTDLLMVPDFAADPNVWYMFDTKKPLKPILWVQRYAPDFTYRIRPDDPIVFDTHTFVYGSKARGAPGWSLPWLSARSGP